MSRSLTEVQRVQFESEVHHIIQPMLEDVRKYFRVKNVTGAGSVNFRTMGTATMQPRESFATPIPTNNTQHSLIACPVADYTASDITDIFSQKKVDFDEKREFQTMFGYSIKRRLLQIAIDALNAHSYTNTVAKNVGGAADDLSLDHVSAAKKIMSRQGVPKDQRTFFCHSNGIDHFMREDKVASADFNTQRVLNSAELDNFYGFNFMEIPDMKEGGLPKSGNDRTNFAFDRRCVGLAIPFEPFIDVFWSGDYGGWRVTAYLSAGAVVIDDLGVVKVTTDETGS